MEEAKPFNPLDKRNLAASIAEALLEKEPVPLGDIDRFQGSGVYAIYYTGPHPAYAPLTAANSNGTWSAPIYVGKAIPKGGRKGAEIEDDTKPRGTSLWSRLAEHAKSIQAAATTLDIDDFSCRFLVVDEIWIPLGENLLISRFAPVWNKHVDGFGNHDPGKGRYNGLRPRWDVVHPGRAWALKCKEREETASLIEGEIADFLRSRAFDQSPKIYKP